MQGVDSKHMENINLFFDKKNECIYKSIKSDFYSLYEWFLDWFENNRDIYIFIGMLPYIAMLCVEANEFIKNDKNFNISMNEIAKKPPLSTIKRIRTNSIKMYTIDHSSKNFQDRFKKVLNKNIEYVQTLNKRLLNTNKSCSPNTYAVYLHEGEIVNTIHLLEKQIGNSIVETKLSNDIEKIVFCIMAYLFKINKLFNCEKIDYERIDKIYKNIHRGIKMKNIIYEQCVNFNLTSEKSDCYLAFLDILSSINFYKFFISNSVCNKECKFKIKYLIFCESLIGLKNITEYESANYLAKTFCNKEIEYFERCIDKYLVNSLLNICKHYYNDKIPIKNNLDSYLKYGVELISKKTFDEFSKEIGSNLDRLQDILKNHFVNS